MTQTLNGTAGDDPLTGTDPGNPANPDGIDIINGLDGNDTLTGLGGNDTISGGLGTDILDGGAGFDTLSFAAATAGVWVNINGGAFGGEAVGDTMTGFEAIIGSNFNDIFGGDGANNIIDGGAGTDIISISGGTDFLDGGANGDFLDCRSVASGVIINVATGIGGGGAAGTTFANFESIIATNFNDILTAAVGGSTMGGLGGNDTLNGGDGNDVLTGDDFLNVIGTSGNDSLSGGGGNDFLQGGALGDVMDGGTGSDTASYENSNAGVIVNLSTGITAGGHADGDTLISVENVLGSTFDDLFVASAAANFFDGRAGGDGVTYAGSTAGVLVNLNGGFGQGGWAEGDTFANMEYVTGSIFDDTLYGNGLVNILDGGNGNDVLEGLVGADTLQGGNGSDTAAYAFSAAAVNVNLTTGIGLGGDAGGDTYSSIENVTGSALADAINGDAGANTLNGGAGDDVLQGRGGADALQGGGGIDTATYGNSAGGVTVNLALGTGLGSDAQGDMLTGIENVIGTALADTLIGDAGANALTGGDGDDTIRSAAGNDVVSGGNGNDLINAGAGADAIDGGAGIDTVFCDSSTVGVAVNLANGTGLSGDAQGDMLTGVENLVGSGFNDTLTGDGGANSLAGGDGDDVLHGGAGADALGGGNGVDSVDYTGSAAISVNLLTGTGTGGDAQGDMLTGIENLFGTTFADTLTGNAGANILGAGDGDDLLLGGGGADQLRGGNGTDTASYAGSAVAVQVDLSASTGTGGDAQGDTLTAIENLIGSSFNDTLTGNAGANDLRGDVGDDVIRGGIGADRIGGGAGVDTADYATSAVGVTIDLAAGTGTGGDAQGDTLFSIENLTGSAFADAMNGDAGANTLDGDAGKDVLAGRGGADILQGGAGVDTATYASSATGVRIDLTLNTASGGDAQGDTLMGIENVTGSTLDDVLIGDSGDNALFGGAGNDLFNGHQNADVISGGAGIDTVYFDTSAAGVQVFLANGIGMGGDAQGDHYSGVENLVGSGLADRLIGDEVVNGLTGGGGNDVIRGGAGADVIDGGVGIDWGDYLGSSAGVTVNLQSGTGIGGDAQGDTLTGIENLMGSVFSDTLTGNGGSNHLNDGGFGAADTLTGGGGSDTYSVYNAGATIVEISGEGLDRVSAGVNYVLASGVSAEYLNTTSLFATYAVNLTGNTLAQLVRGNDGANILDGGGGRDVLFGMGGADSFRFSTALGPGNVDRIADFNAAQDQIQLDNAIFAALGFGALAASAFKDIVFAPKDADDRIIYNSDTGALCYDADGSGTAFGNVRFATLTGSPVLTAADFIVV